MPAKFEPEVHIISTFEPENLDCHGRPALFLIHNAEPPKISKPPGWQRYRLGFSKLRRLPDQAEDTLCAYISVLLTVLCVLRYGKPMRNVAGDDLKELIGRYANTTIYDLPSRLLTEIEYEYQHREKGDVIIGHDTDRKH